MPHLCLEPTPFKLFDQVAELFNGTSGLCFTLLKVSRIYSARQASHLPQTQVLKFRTNVVEVIGEHPIDLHVFFSSARLVDTRPWREDLLARVQH